MKTLYRNGFYREMPHAEATDPSINDFIGKARYGADKSKIINYLQSGAVVIHCCGTSIDVVKPENGTAGVPSFYTDGKWVWPGDLWYYVNRYDLLLPDAFVDDMRNNNWINDIHVAASEEFEIV